MYLASFDLLHCNCLSSPGSCPGPDVVHRPSGLQYEINLVIIMVIGPGIIIIQYTHNENKHRKQK